MITKLGKELTKTGGIPGGMMTGALWAAIPALGVASGEQSVGEAVGETAGGFLGFDLGERLYNKFVPTVQAAPVANLKPLPKGPWYKSWFSKANFSNMGQHAKNLFTTNTLKRFGRGVGGFLASGAAATLGASLVGSALGKALPVYKRNPPTGQDYFNT